MVWVTKINLTKDVEGDQDWVSDIDSKVDSNDEYDLHVCKQREKVTKNGEGEEKRVK